MFMVKRDTFPKTWFFWKSDCTNTFEQSPTMDDYCDARQIFYWIIWTPMAQVFQNTLTFDRYLFNSRSNLHVNLVHWNSLHPKNAILPSFLGQTPQFLCEDHKTRTNNLHHRKAGSVAVILSLRVGFQHIQKVVQ